MPSLAHRNTSSTFPILPGQTPEEVIHVLELAAEETGVELTHIEIIEREE
jgi:hypothetical protein